jgi:hypothetical protein
VGIFSPAFWFSDSLYAYIGTQPKTVDTKFYFVAGQYESLSLVSDMDSMITLLQSIGHNATNIATTIKPDGAHSEWFWKREFKSAYQWLYGQHSTSLHKSKNPSLVRVGVYPNPVADSFYISVDAKSVNIETVEGKQVAQWKNTKAMQYLEVKHIPAGMYLLRIVRGKEMITQRLMKQ